MYNLNKWLNFFLLYSNQLSRNWQNKLHLSYGTVARWPFPVYINKKMNNSCCDNYDTIFNLLLDDGGHALCWYCKQKPKFPWSPSLASLSLVWYLSWYGVDEPSNNKKIRLIIMKQRRRSNPKLQLTVNGARIDLCVDAVENASAHPHGAHRRIWIDEPVEYVGGARNQ